MRRAIAVIGILSAASVARADRAATRTAAQQLADAATAHDAKAIAAMFDGTVEFGGAWFADGACTAKFPVAGAVRAPARDLLAACLASLPLTVEPSEPASATGAMLAYAPGIELAVDFTDAPTPKLRWIGYAGRTGPTDAIPTITPAAFDALRGAKAHDLALDGHLDKHVAEELAAEHLTATRAWFKICIDQTGAITGIHPRRAATAAANDAWVEQIAHWQPSPFVVAGRPMPVCTLERFAYPSAPGATDPHDVPEVHYAFAPRPAAHASSVAPNVLESRRISGDPQIKPDLRTKAAIHDSGLTKLTASIEICIDETGVPYELTLLKSSGSWPYDERLIANMWSWRYSPYSVDGKPAPACTAVTFIYAQR